MYNNNGKACDRSIYYGRVTRAYMDRELCTYFVNYNHNILILMYLFLKKIKNDRFGIGC